MSNSGMIRNFDDLVNVIDQFNDDFFWKPITCEESLKNFDDLLALVDESQSWPISRNRDKGRVLEEFAEFLFGRFGDVDIKCNRLAGGNETDVEVTLSEKIRPSYMNDYIGPKIICECKNKKSESIDVGVVTKLHELLGGRGAQFGVFISILGLGGTGWRFGEGKRKKLFIESQRSKRIISFTVDELRSLRGGNANFYTMIKQKVQLLYDEIDDDTPGIPTTESHPEYSKYILETVQHLRKCDLIDEEELSRICKRIESRYGREVIK